MPWKDSEAVKPRTETCMFKRFLGVKGWEVAREKSGVRPCHSHAQSRSVTPRITRSKSTSPNNDLGSPIQSARRPPAPSAPAIPASLQLFRVSVFWFSSLTYWAGWCLAFFLSLLRCHLLSEVLLTPSIPFPILFFTSQCWRHFAYFLCLLSVSSKKNKSSWGQESLSIGSLL